MSDSPALLCGHLACKQGECTGAGDDGGIEGYLGSRNGAKLAEVCWGEEDPWTPACLGMYCDLFIDMAAANG